MSTRRSRAVPVKKTVAKKVAAKKAAAKKAVPAKTAAKRAPAKKAAAKKAPVKKAAVKKTVRRMTHRDLNAVRPVGATTDKDFWATRTRTVTADNLTAHFGDLTEPVIDFINAADSIVGCVAWLTSKQVLEALAARPGGVSLCVQKETNLRANSGTWPAELRRRYRQLPAGPLRRTMPDPLPRLAGPPRIGSIRCVGYANSGASQNSPRMHHKFIVAGTVNNGQWTATAVWTGSFNFSTNAGDSTENAVVINDPAVASAYLNEFARISALSEPLDWTSRIAQPEHRLQRQEVGRKTQTSRSAGLPKVSA